MAAPFYSMPEVEGDAQYGRPPPPNLWASASCWLEQACASTCDAEGNLVSLLPELLARALDTHMAAAAEAERAAELQLAPALQCAAPLRRPPPSSLHGSRPPAITISAYASRLGRYCGCSPVCFLAAYAYALRLAAAAAVGARGGLVVTPLTAHRLLITGTVISIKMSEDRYYSNEFYAQVGGISLAEMNAMELDMLQRLDYRARVDVPELCAALRDACVRATSPFSLPPSPPEPAERAAAVAAAAAAQARAAVAAASMLLREGEGDAADADSCCTVAAGEAYGGRASSSEDAVVSEATTEAAVGASGAAAAGSAWWDAADATSRTADVSAADCGRGTPRLPLRRWPGSFEKRRGCSVEAAAAATAAAGPEPGAVAERERLARRQGLAVDA